MRIFGLTTSQSQQLILKVDLKGEFLYLYSKFFLERFNQYLKKSKNGFPIYLQIFSCRGRIHFLEIDPYTFRVLGPILAI